MGHFMSKPTIGSNLLVLLHKTNPKVIVFFLISFSSQSLVLVPRGLVCVIDNNKISL